MNRLLRFLYATFSIVLYCCFESPTVFGVEPTLLLSVHEDLPPVKLRGYGVISATLNRSANALAASALEVKSENEEQGRIIHAKFLSDLEAATGRSPC